jgi:class 3 adenylate cyclase/tetratricopeptide (TPR) repeat protein
VRKTVTILFCDVVDSTVMGEQSDPETVRHAMSRYFDEMRAIVERHGGVVERFRGDEVMAVFGVPTVHEDDALRAVRTGMAMQRRLVELNEELKATWGVELECRIGINTGEVVAGDPGTGATFVTGDAVNLAKRLEQAAGPGEILIGTATYPLVRDAVEVGPRERFTVKGKAEPVSPFRLDHVDATAAGVARRLDAELVDREAELAVLHSVAATSERDHPCQLLTVVGPAGIGKSRLVAELLGQLDGRFRSLRGRCLPYGEAITFWPVRDIIREAGGEEALTALLAGVEDGIRIAELIRTAVGQAAGAAAAEETFWAIRRFLEELARERPLAVCFDDVHWAAPTLLDLIEYLAGWMRDAPILLLVLARSDLLEARPTWANPRPNSTVVALEPLADEHTDLLLERLRDGVELPEATRERIVDAAEGNPLFVEQMAAMAAEAGEEAETLRMPPTIQALLAERLDRLSIPERTLIERASVIGKEFPYRAVVALSPPEDRADAAGHLFSLIRKDLVGPVRASGGDDILGFRHDLIRAVTYEALPKAVRARLHEGFADWLEENAGARMSELEEIVGFHLEQAHRYLVELRVADGQASELARRAAYLLGSAGRRASARGDGRTAANLLRRATRLPGAAEPRRIALLLDLATALRESGHLDEASEILTSAATAAAASSDERLQARTTVERAFLRLHTDLDGFASEAPDVAQDAIAVLERHGDDFGLARALTVIGLRHYVSCRIEEMEKTLEPALVHARRAGDGRQVSTILNGLARAALAGPTPVERALERCREIAREGGQDRSLGAIVTGVQGVLEAMRGDIRAGRRLYAESHAILDDLGMSRLLAATRSYSASVELLADDPVAAERELRAGSVVLEEIGDTANLSTVAWLLAEALRRQERHEEALQYTQVSERTAADHDTWSQVGWRATCARLESHEGRHAEATRLAEEASGLAAETDYLNMQGDALSTLGEVLAAAGDRAAAVDAFRQAVQRYDSKGNLVSATATRVLIDGATARA